MRRFSADFSKFSFEFGFFYSLCLLAEGTG